MWIDNLINGLKLIVLIEYKNGLLTKRICWMRCLLIEYKNLLYWLKKRICWIIAMIEYRIYCTDRILLLYMILYGIY